MNEFINILQTIHPLTSFSRKYLSKHITTVTLERRQVFIQPGEVIPAITFIQKGLLRCYHILNEREICSRFLKTGDLMPSLSCQANLHFHFQAIEPCTLSSILHTPKRASDMIIIMNKLLATELEKSENITSVLRLKKAKDRYHVLFNDDPDLLSRIPSRYLASYLNISEGTISRIRGGRY
jgi:CRP-like cAMP-binding protein